MKVINYTEVPSTIAEDFNRGKTKWLDGKCVGLDEGPAVTLYLGHRTETRLEYDAESSGVPVERTVTLAFPVRVAKPVTRDAAINAAEMEAYGLRTPMEVASFGASLARKFRRSPEDDEIREHDEFIAWVKEELERVGVGKPSSGGGEASALTFASLFRISRLSAGKTELTDEEALSVQPLFPDWTTSVGGALKAGQRVRYAGKLYEVRQEIAAVLETQPPSTETLALYRVIEQEHRGTAGDPIPYEQGMELEYGKYYSQYGVTYLCTQAMQAMAYDLKDLPAHVQAVE